SGDRGCVSGPIVWQLIAHGGALAFPADSIKATQLLQCRLFRSDAVKREGNEVRKTDVAGTVRAFCVADTCAQIRVVVNCTHEHSRDSDRKARQSTLGH